MNERPTIDRIGDDALTLRLHAIAANAVALARAAYGREHLPATDSDMRAQLNIFEQLHIGFEAASHINRADGPFMLVPVPSLTPQQVGTLTGKHPDRVVLDDPDVTVIARADADDPLDLDMRNIVQKFAHVGGAS